MKGMHGLVSLSCKGHFLCIKFSLHLEKLKNAHPDTLPVFVQMHFFLVDDKMVKTDIARPAPSSLLY